MYGAHVVENLPIYINGGLTREESDRVAHHLIDCVPCRLEFEQMKVEATLQNRLAQLEEQRRIVRESRTQTALRSSGGQDHAEDIRAWLKKMENRYFTVALVIAVLISAAALYLIRAPSEEASAAVLVTKGAPVLDSARIMGAVGFETGGWLETDSASAASIKLAGGTELIVAPETRIGLAAFDRAGYRLALQRGTIRASIPDRAPVPVSINTPSGLLTGPGGDCTIRVDDAGAAVVDVKSGFVEARLGAKRSLLPAGASCEMRPQLGPGAPVFEDASQSFKDALERFDFGTGADERNNQDPLAVLLSEARERDALTLWHLLSTANDSQRTVIFLRLKELIPLPAGVQNDQIVQMNEEALGKWLAEIERRCGIPTGQLQLH